MVRYRAEYGRKCVVPAYMQEISPRTQAVNFAMDI